MTRQSKSQCCANNLFIRVALVAITVFVIGGSDTGVEADEFPHFLVKTAKNIPRMGRRSGSIDNLFLKTSKNVPRIGRRGGFSSPSLPSYTTIDHYPVPSKRPMEYPPIAGDDPWSWEYYTHAIEESPEQWKSLTGYLPGINVNPYSEGFDDEMWQREKRTGSVQGEA